MKIEQLLVQYFYNTKKIILQGIGTLTLSADFILPTENEKAFEMPQDAINFQPNTKAPEDEGLIDYIVQQTRKIKPLASADLESYIVLGTQFLNIGKPFKIEGIGLLEKNQAGEYQFTPQSQFINQKAEVATVQLKEKADDKISFSQKDIKNNSGKKIVAALATIIVLGGLGWGAWYLLNNKNENESSTKNIIVPAVNPVESALADSLKKDSARRVLQLRADSILTAQNAPANFKVVIKNYPSLWLAQRAYDRLTKYGHSLLIYTDDSVTYKLAMPFIRPLADTINVRDSVRKLLFARNPYIELK